MVMWFGFDWSKAAVVVVMTFFPMFVNTVAGLGAAGSMELGLDAFLRGRASAGTLIRLAPCRSALPFVFNALKINSTLALIGAIVAEFFGSPTVGMGFRISTEAARLNMGWSGRRFSSPPLPARCLRTARRPERFATFWHPSQRRA